MLHPEGDSMWGRVNTCVKIATNIYYVFAEHGEGVMVQKEHANQILSPKAIAIGTADNEFLCFERDKNADIPIYELLQKRIAYCRQIELKAMEVLKGIKEDGHLCLTDYFGECPPPKECRLSDCERVRNGIYFLGQGSGSLFAVHKVVTENFLSPMACDFAICRMQSDYLYYDLTTCAIPLYELGQIFDEVKAAILSPKRLYATIYQNFGLYFSLYNATVPEEEQIPAVEGPSGPFLQRQLNQGAQDKEENRKHPNFPAG